MIKAIVRSSFLAVLMLGAGAVLASAQEKTPHADAFVGYSYLRFDTGANVNGFDASVTGNINDWLGITGEVSGHYREGDSAHFILGGPRFTYRKTGTRVEPFVHALVGVTLINSAPYFGMALGGGVDVKINDKLAIRAVQADYAPIISNGNVVHNARVSAGIVFRFQ
jgi:hypothetical protein